MKVRLAAELQPDSIVDGDGVRTVVWFQGCSHNCLGCHNPQSHDFNGGFEIDIEDIYKEIDSLKYQNGLTLSGGDPFFQPEAALEITKYAKSKGYNVWSYTGFTYENLLKISDDNPVIKELLDNLDVLIDGKFEQDKKSFNCKYRGSTNQRIIDLNKTREKGELILLY
ncbi:MAG: anaerobic ribonucleoside-triphosphate reductase activating protein [Bacilli bacterium]|nr:anaerobic ribonucleoside-triphosphate reductase activating protein [Bacilli bacterium]